ncbi:OmpA family protein [Luteipulveratus sp. YIM 133132]|uniref:channel-forming protein ArfA/OmpATb n=1 Tax=Luteipulveratus flavus TaxID=3031728 RepID=UPI0023B0BD1C|nr:OmpA family protein [Luteipulveratus sp. YIM 133132]MDE9366102.1 OmpA family protein [Luteipulveratus sp. YIM 133132]
MDPTGDAQSRGNADRSGDGEGATASTSGGQGTEYDTVTRRARRNIGGWWWLALLAVPLLLAALASFIGRGGIEDDLTSASRKALEGQGITGADVDFSGRDGTISLPAGADAAKAKKVVEGVDGVRAADVKGGAAAAGAPSASPTASATASPSPSSSESAGGSAGTESASSSPSSSESATSSESPSSSAAPAGSGTFTLTNDGDSVVVEGVVPDDASKQAVVAAARKAAGDKTVVDQVTVRSGAPAPDAAQLAKGLSSLPTADGAKLAYDGKSVTLTGQVADDATKKAAGDKATADFPGVTVDNQLTVKSAGTADCSKVNATVMALIKDDKPTFADNSTVLAVRSRSTLNQVADAIKACPDAKVSVAGYTDSTGTPANNLRLSQGRANAVRAYLGRQGVSADAVTATGYGQAKPIASNATAAGREANRRVDITVQGG